MPHPTIKTALMKAFRKALKAIGPRHWWPGETDFEIMVGAILTQNTAWKNVEKAIAELKSADLLHAKGLAGIPEAALAEKIRSSGYFRMKAKKLKALVEFLKSQGGIAKLKKHALEDLRTRLLAVYGIGPETADSILLYALGKPSFVVDAYTRRIFSRHGLFKADASYDEMRDFFMNHLPHDCELFNELHALIVHIGHHHCRTKPLCEGCPWNWITFPPAGAKARPGGGNKGRPSRG